MRFAVMNSRIQGYPKRQAASIAMAAMREFSPRFARIIACCHGEEDLRIYRELLALG